MTGANKFAATRDEVWNVVVDPAVLQRAMPDCQKFDPVPEASEETYAFQLVIAVSGFKSTYKGKIRIRDKQPPERLHLAIEGTGITGRLSATAELTFVDHGAETEIQHQWEVTVEGPLKALGETGLSGIGRWFINEFFKRLQGELRGGTQG